MFRGRREAFARMPEATGRGGRQSGDSAAQGGREDSGGAVRNGRALTFAAHGWILNTGKRVNCSNDQKSAAKRRRAAALPKETLQCVRFAVTDPDGNNLCFCTPTR